MKKGLCIFLLCSCLIGLLGGCNQSQTSYVPTGDGLSWEEPPTGTVETEPTVPEVQELLLTYYPNRSMNPYLCTDFTNRALFPLLYQSLFIVDRNYNVEPMLCKNFSISEDMKTYTFYMEDATFSDGTHLTAEDVLASLQAAQKSNMYRGRFIHVVDLRLSSDGGVIIQMDTNTENLPLLLDIPVIQASQVEESRPLGTGPYILSISESGATLNRRTNWWCSADMQITAPVISLLEAESPTQIRDNFQFSDLSLVCADPGSDNYADYLCDFELWDCENGIFLYLACSGASGVFSDPEVRSALTYAIDRDYLVDAYYRGFARSASLPASPLSPYYNSTLASKYEYSRTKFTKAVSDAGMWGKTVSILVNSDDSLRVRVAKAIGEMLEACGLHAQIKALSGEAYRYELQAWNYDLFLGQTRLSANMDLSSFFSNYGSLSYGGLSDVSIYTLCRQALENHGNYYTLHKTIMEDGKLCPILFRSYAVYATRGLLTGLTPSRDNVFYYSLGKNMEHALIRKPKE